MNRPMPTEKSVYVLRHITACWQK